MLAQSVFLLQRGQTNSHTCTGATDQSIHAPATAVVGNCLKENGINDLTLVCYFTVTTRCNSRGLYMLGSGAVTSR